MAKLHRPGTFRASKIEKPEKVVFGSSKSFSALFSESLHKINFFELPCWGGIRILKNEQNRTGPLEELKRNLSLSNYFRTQTMGAPVCFQFQKNGFTRFQMCHFWQIFRL